MPSLEELSRQFGFSERIDYKVRDIEYCNRMTYCIQALAEALQDSKRKNPVHNRMVKYFSTTRQANYRSITDALYQAGSYWLHKPKSQAADLQKSKKYLEHALVELEKSPDSQLTSLLLVELKNCYCALGYYFPDQKKGFAMYYTEEAIKRFPVVEKNRTHAKSVLNSIQSMLEYADENCINKRVLAKFEEIMLFCIDKYERYDSGRASAVKYLESVISRLKDKKLKKK